MVVFYEGVVLEFDGRYLHAEVYNITDRNTPAEQWQLPYGDFSKEDQARIQAGAVFHVSVKDNLIGGMHTAFTKTTWTSEQVKRIREKADEMYGWFLKDQQAKEQTHGQEV